MKNRKLISLLLSVFYITIAGCCMLYFYKESTTTYLTNAVPSPTGSEALTAASSLQSVESSQSAESVQSVESSSSNGQEYLLEPASADSDGIVGIFSEDPPTRQTTEDIPEKEDISSASKDDVFPLPNASIPFISGIKNRINIRNSPQMSGSIIGKISPYRIGEVLKIIDNEWALVSYEDTIGYAAYRYLRFSLPKPLENSKSADVTEITEMTSSADQNNSEIASSSAEPSSTTETSESTEAASSAKNKGSAAVKKDSVYIVEGCYIRSTPEWDNTQNILRAADKGTTYPHVPDNDTPNFYAILLPNKTTAYVSIFYTEIKEITEKQATSKY